MFKSTGIRLYCENLRIPESQIELNIQKIEWLGTNFQLLEPRSISQKSLWLFTGVNIWLNHSVAVPVGLTKFLLPASSTELRFLSVSIWTLWINSMPFPSLNMKIYYKFEMNTNFPRCWKVLKFLILQKTGRFSQKRQILDLKKWAERMLTQFLFDQIADNAWNKLVRNFWVRKMSTDCTLSTLCKSEKIRFCNSKLRLGIRSKQLQSKS